MLAQKDFWSTKKLVQKLFESKEIGPNKILGHKNQGPQKLGHSYIWTNVARTNVAHDKWNIFRNLSLDVSSKLS